MRRHIRKTKGVGIASGLILVALIAAPSSAAQVDYFLKIPGVDGESTDSRHKGWVDIVSYDWGATYDPASGKVQVHDLFCTKHTDRASPLLTQALLTKDTLASATLEVEKLVAGKPVVYLKYLLTDVHVTSYALGEGAQGDVVPVDSFSFNYSQIKYEYSRYDESTGQLIEVIKGGYDVTTGTFLPGTIGGGSV